MILILRLFPFWASHLSVSLSRVDDILPNNNNKNVVSTTAMEINEETLNSLMFPWTHLSPRGITSSYKQTAQGRNYTIYIVREKRRRKQAFPYTANEYLQTKHSQPDISEGWGKTTQCTHVSMRKHAPTPTLSMRWHGQVLTVLFDL